jgi:hypothetical protein
MIRSIAVDQVTRAVDQVTCPLGSFSEAISDFG